MVFEYYTARLRLLRKMEQKQKTLRDGTIWRHSKFMISQEVRTSDALVALVASFLLLGVFPIPGPREGDEHILIKLLNLQQYFTSNIKRGIYAAQGGWIARQQPKAARAANIVIEECARPCTTIEIGFWYSIDTLLPPCRYIVMTHPVGNRSAHVLTCSARLSLDSELQNASNILSSADVFCLRF